MKAHFSRDRRSSIRGARKPEEKGVALVTVLAIVLLMAVLVMSFFEMAKSELNASLKDSDNLKARSFADAAVNIAIAQIREATTQKSTSEEFAPWSSQPGAIRVYQPYGDLKAIYKLYSSSRMLADSMQQLERDDIKKDWDTEPDQWVDMNAPVVIPGIIDEKNSDQSEVFFPIADPRAARGQKQDSVEGFSYKDAVNGVVRPSGRTAQFAAPADAGALALPSGGRHDWVIEQGRGVCGAGRRGRADQGKPDCRADCVLD